MEKGNPPWEKIVECIKTCQCLNLTPQDLIKYYKDNKAVIIKQYERKSTNLGKSQALLGTNETRAANPKDRSNLESDIIDRESVQNHVEG